MYLVRLMIEVDKGVLSSSEEAQPCIKNDS